MAPDTVAVPVVTGEAAPQTWKGANRALVVVAGLGLAAVLACLAYLFVDLTGNTTWVLKRRGTTVATMAVVAMAIGVATVVFHTVTTNQILTPSIMGFDALYILVQTVAVASLGVSGIVTVDPLLEFGGQAVVMIALSMLLYRWLLVDLRRSLHLLILVGVVVGGLFRSLSTLLQRAMDPTAFAVLQDRFFADFTGAHRPLLAIGAVLVVATTLLLWTRRDTLDVLGLGRELSTNLGVNHRRATLWCLAAVSLLVAVATALVGPTSFFGLLVAHLAYRLTGSTRHVVTLPAAALAAVICLVGGQVLFERVLGFEGSLSMVVDFLGGILFVVLLLRRSRA